jgi:hypothetical protein
MAELGMYDANEDVSGWAFDHRYEDGQWQEPQLILSGGPWHFTGPPAGNKYPQSGQSRDCERYFRRFWEDEALERVVQETNR